MKQRDPIQRHHPLRLARGAMVLLGAMLVVGCAIDRAGTASSADGLDGPDATATARALATPIPQVEPTAPPAPPTAAALQEPTPIPTPLPEPTATPTPLATTVPLPGPTPTPFGGPGPLPTRAPDDGFDPRDVEPGIISLPVGSTSFVLADRHPVLQLGGHTLIYVDDGLQAEVDIFTPHATSEGTVLIDYDDLIMYLLDAAVFDDIVEVDFVTIAGFPTRVFEGTPERATPPVRAFYTDRLSLQNDINGWFPPARMRLWVVDAPFQPIIVSAESLEDPGQFDDALRLAEDILSTIDFGPS